MHDGFRYLVSTLLFVLAAFCFLGDAPIPAAISGALGLYFLPPLRHRFGFAPSRALSIVVSLVGFVALAMAIASIGDAVKAAANAGAADSAGVERDSAATTDIDSAGARP